VPYHDSALHFFAEAFGSALAKQLDDIFDRLLGTVTEMHTIVAGQVAAAFAGGDHVVRGDAVFGMRQGNIDQLRAHVLVLFDGRIHGGFHLRVHAGGQLKFLGDAQPQPFDRLR